MTDIPKTPWTVKLLETLRAYEGKDRMEVFGDLVEEMKDKIKPVAFSTGIIPTFDSLSGGIQEGEVVIIGGASNEGKTLLVMSLIAAFERQGLICAFFSFEQTVEQVAEKFDYHPPFFYVPRSVDYETKYDEFIEQLKKNKKHYLGKLPSPQLQWLYLKLLEMQAKGNKPHVIFVDYLHMLMGRGAENKVWALGDVMLEIKQMALRFRLVIFLVCHTTKEAANREEPSLADLRDSGWIVNVPDIILLLWRKLDKYTKEPGSVSVIKIAKHRRKGNAKNRKVELVMNTSGILVEHIEEEWDAAGSY